MTDIPLSALGRLNTHARAAGGGGFFGGGEKWAIYAYKSVAALHLAEQNLLTLRLIKWTGRCNRCTSGRFQHYTWDDGYTVACRDCRGTGFRTLHFSETTLPDGQIWHHPWEGRDTDGSRIADAVLGRLKYANETLVTPDGAPIKWHEPGEWGPHLKASKLDRSELIPLLNEVEDWIAAYRSGGLYSFVTDRAKRFLGKRDVDWDGYWNSGYRIDLGRATEGCFKCGAPDGDIPHQFGRVTEHFHWSLPVCDQHRSEKIPDGPPPPSLITPDVQRWLDRHDHARKAF